MQLPLFLWQLAVLIVFAVTETQVDDMQGPLASIYSQTRVGRCAGQHSCMQGRGVCMESLPPGCSGESSDV